MKRLTRSIRRALLKVLGRAAPEVEMYTLYIASTDDDWREVEEQLMAQRNGDGQHVGGYNG